MKEIDLLDLARRAAETAKASGAQDARARANRSREVVVEWRDGRLDRIRESVKMGLSLSLYVDGRYSANGTSDLRPDSVKDWIESAVQMTRYLAPDEHRHLPDPARYFGELPGDLELHDSSVSSITPEQRLDVARRIEEASRSGPDSGSIVSVTSSTSDYEYTGVCVCTNGLEATEGGTYLERSCNVSVEDADDRKPTGYAYGSTRFLADLPDIESVGREATRRAMAQIGSKQAPTGLYDLVIENRSVSRLASHLTGPLSGSAVQQKRSFMADRLGQKLFGDLLTITDDPHLVRGLSSTLWDPEGMATLVRPVIDGGVLRAFYLDTYYGSKLGMDPTTGSTTNLVWATGERSLDAMVADVQQGILVESFLGGNSNSTTGDFSLGIKGFLVQKGQIVHPVSEMNVAGNHLDFWTRLAQLGSDPWPYSSCRAPSLLFSQVQCSGA